jgi:regulator of sigma E protease
LETLNSALNILKVAVGLGFVIFLHELGHFLLAKWNGVKVEKFSIGFGPVLLSWRSGVGLRVGSSNRQYEKRLSDDREGVGTPDAPALGETEYVLSAVPLGGFVKMLGEGEDEQRTSDPRAFSNKPVGARMAIISAGVIMNLILGLACFVFAYGRGGMLVLPARIGAVMASSPAYEAGIEAGDEIVAIDGRRDVTFNNLLQKVALSGSGQVLRLELKKIGRDRPVAVEVQPRRERTAEHPTIGVLPSESLELDPDRPFLAPAGMEGDPKALEKAFRKGDKVTGIGPAGGPITPVADSAELKGLLVKYRDRPVDVEVQSDTDSAKRTVTLPPNRFVSFGFRPAVGPINGIRDGSPAAKAGFRKGDRIVSVDGRTDFDPLRLPDDIYEKAGREVEFKVLRDGNEVALTATPDDSPPWIELILPNEPLDVPGLGLAFPVSTKVASVDEGSPAARAGLKPGDVIQAYTLEPLEPGDKPAKPNEIDEDSRETGWLFPFSVIQDRPKGPVKLAIVGAKGPITLTPEPVDDWYHPSRGLVFLNLRRPLPPLDWASAIRRGGEDTLENIVSIYQMIRGLFQRQIGGKNIAGPVRIAQIAYHYAGANLASFVQFLGMLSINLAVINFLPIPPLDGGQMTFLVAEKVRGRPLPDSALIVGTYAGLFLVLCLMVFVIAQDIWINIQGQG